MPKQTRRGRKFWVKLVKEFEQGGAAEGHQEFADRQKVQCDSFRRWLYRLRAEKRGRPWRSSGRGRRSKLAGAGWPLVEVQGVPVSSSRFEVELSGGRRVLVPASFEVEALRRLLAVLAETVS